MANGARAGEAHPWVEQAYRVLESRHAAVERALSERDARQFVRGSGKSPSQVGPLGFTSKTEFEGLFLCGQSTTSHGVAGVTASGVEAAKAVLGVRTRDLLTGMGGGLRLYSADGVTDARMEGTDGEVERMEGEV
ncbi:MAG: hypothetical protein IPG44_09435 [Anaerolineales bacterium]|nr:hypothetical protein [Anaerolineales bacterium]